MKLFLYIFLPPLLASCATAPTATPASVPIQPISTQPITNNSVGVIAHRGGAGLAPENTLASFRNGLALNADILEMDAHLSKDGVVVIIHDDTIDRTTDGRGRVADYTLAQLQSFNAAATYANG